KKVQSAGSYSFTADIEQTTIPLAIPANVGRSSKKQASRIEGSSNLPNRQMQFTIWSQGGSVLNPDSGIQMKIANDVAYAKRGQQDWEEVEDMSSAFAPQGDFLAFLSSVKDVAIAGAESRGGVSFQRYTFKIDGPGFAEFVRDGMQTRLAQK